MEFRTSYLRRVTSTPDPDIFEKYRDTPPISIAILLQTYVLPLAESSIYTTNLYHDTPRICIAILLQKYSPKCPPSTVKRLIPSDLLQSPRNAGILHGSGKGKEAELVSTAMGLVVQPYIDRTSRARCPAWEKSKGGVSKRELGLSPIGPKRALLRQFLLSPVAVGCGGIGPNRPRKGPSPRFSRL